MIDNHPPSEGKKCQCPTCSAPRFDKRAIYDATVRQKMKEFVDACNEAGIPYFVSACYAVLDKKMGDTDGTLMGMHSCQGPHEDGWQPLCYKVAANAVVAPDDGFGYSMISPLGALGPLNAILDKLISEASAEDDDGKASS